MREGEAPRGHLDYPFEVLEYSNAAPSHRCALDAPQRAFSALRVVAGPFRVQPREGAQRRQESPRLQQFQQRDGLVEELLLVGAVLDACHEVPQDAVRMVHLHATDLHGGGTRQGEEDTAMVGRRLRGHINGFGADAKLTFRISEKSGAEWATARRTHQAGQPLRQGVALEKGEGGSNSEHCAFAATAVISERENRAKARESLASR